VGSGLCGKLVDWIDGREEIAGTGVIYTIGELSWGGGRCNSCGVHRGAAAETVEAASVPLTGRINRSFPFTTCALVGSRLAPVDAHPTGRGTTQSVLA
jgi:hypothetical protein